MLLHLPTEDLTEPYFEMFINGIFSDKKDEKESEF